jgi:nucleotide-binding universal stress UspA family protein
MTTPMRTILCPVDFSPASLAAADNAAMLSKALGTRLILLHVVTGAVTVGAGLAGAESATPLAQHEHAMRGQLNDLASKLCERGAQIVQVLLVAGPPVELIGRVADDVGANLIVMGRASRRGVGHMIGSVTERMARRGSTPVIACPAVEAP